MMFSPIIDLINNEKFFQLLKNNFGRMEQDWTIGRLSSFVHMKVSLKKRLNYFKIWLMDDLEKSIHQFPLKLTRNSSLDPWLLKKTFIY
jgi:hypothetical protein